MIKIYLTVLFFLVSFDGTLAQSWNLPQSRSNDRFSSDWHNIVRPALSIRGFDNASLPTHYNTFDHSKVYGLKQILERACGIGITQDSKVGGVLLDIADQSSAYLNLIDTHVDTVAIMADRVKSVATIALITYIIEKNDGGPGEGNVFVSDPTCGIPSMPSHSVALARLMNYLTNPPPDIIPDHPSTQPFKKGMPGMNIAQMWDMYLALENAYEDLDGSAAADASLLNTHQKADWNLRIYEFIREIYGGTVQNVPVPSGYQLHEVQAGNWPLIGFVAAGYMNLGFNGSYPPSADIYAHVVESLGHTCFVIA